MSDRKKLFSIVPSDKMDFDHMVVYHEGKFDRVVFYIPGYANSTPLDMGFYENLVSCMTAPVAVVPNEE